MSTQPQGWEEFLVELLLESEPPRWPLPDGRQPCAPCRGYGEYCEAIGCYGAVLDELLWELFGWLWLLGGRTELETWDPAGDTRLAWVDDDELLDMDFEVVS